MFIYQAKQYNHCEDMDNGDVIDENILSYPGHDMIDVSYRIRDTICSTIINGNDIKSHCNTFEAVVTHDGQDANLKGR